MTLKQWAFLLCTERIVKLVQRLTNIALSPFFGTEPVFVAITWKKLCRSGWLEYAGKKSQPEHLLWAFMWLKCYHNEEFGTSLAGNNVAEKTFHEKVWLYVKEFPAWTHGHICGKCSNCFCCCCYLF